MSTEVLIEPELEFDPKVFMLDLPVGVGEKGLVPAMSTLRGEKSSIEQSQGLAKHLTQNPAPTRVGVAQGKFLPTRFKENFEKISELIAQAEKEKLDLLVFPELTIPGYLSHDLFSNSRYLDENLEVLKWVAEKTVGLNVAVVVGFAEKISNSIPQKSFNSAAVIHNGEIIDTVRKTLLPDYDIFWEGRYFASAPERKVVTVNGFKLGIGICEDLWDKNYATKVYDELAKKGAEYFINLSASPFQAGKAEVRHGLIHEIVERHHKPFLYANMVGSQDGYEGEIVFDGRSMVMSKNGSLVGLGKDFREDLIIVDHAREVEIPLPTWTSVEETFKALTLGIKDYFARTGNNHAYIGLSGGIDSAVTAALLVEALGKENVTGVTMPSSITSSETKNDALDLAQNLGIDCMVWPISEQYQAWDQNFHKHLPEVTTEALVGLAKENAQARIRGQNLMSLSNSRRGSLVVSTGNKTEMALGYCTLYGDMCAGLNALGDVSKLMVYDLANYYNSIKGSAVIPNTTIARPPTAELAPGQTDEKGLGASYQILSPLVDDIIEGKLSRSELVEKYSAYDVDRVEGLVVRNEHKRRQAPPAIRVTDKAFGAGRRVPVDSKVCI